MRAVGVHERGDLTRAGRGRAAGLARAHRTVRHAGALSTPVWWAPGRCGPTRPPPRGRGPEITFARSGLTVRWSEEYGSLLELAEACDVPVRWSCRTGVCHTCVTGLLAGEITYRTEPLEPPGRGGRADLLFGARGGGSGSRPLVTYRRPRAHMW